MSRASHAARAKINRQNASRPRISAGLRSAVRAFVWEGLSAEEAAKRGNLRRNSFLKALRRPHVKAMAYEEFRQFREGELFQAYARMIQLGERAESEDVQLRANQWIAGVDGLSPMKKALGRVQVTHSFEGYDYSQAHTPADPASAERG